MMMRNVPNNYTRHAKSLPKSTRNASSVVCREMLLSMLNNYGFSGKLLGISTCRKRPSKHQVWKI